MGYPRFAANPKRIVNVFYFLDYLWYEAQGDTWTEVPQQTILSFFRSDRMNYCHFLDILEKEKIIEVDHSYATASLAAPHGFRAKCKSYRILKKGVDFLQDCCTMRISYLQTSKGKKELRNSPYYRKFKKETPEHNVARRVKENIESLSNLAYLCELNNSITNQKQKLNNYSSLLAISEKKYTCNMSDKTGRNYNPFSRMTKNIKFAAEINGQKLKCTIDARACHPSFFAMYCQGLTDTDLTGDMIKWNHIFFNKGEEHPIKVICDMCGLPFSNDMKITFSSFLNGGQQFPEYQILDDWMRNNFPLLYYVWNKEGRKKTGAAISKVYESAIFRHPKVSELAKALGVYACDNHDELMIYSNDNLAVKAFVETFKNLANGVFDREVIMKETWFNQDVPPTT